MRTWRRNLPASGDDGDGDDRTKGPRPQPEVRTGVWCRNRSDGFSELTAILTDEDAAVVRAALETQGELAWRARSNGTDNGTDNDDTAQADPTPRSERMADALVAMAATALEAGDIPIVRGRHTEVILHVDHSYLSGDADSGRCHLDIGPSNSLAIDHTAARRLACDARIRAMIHSADGSVVDLGRTQRLVSDKQRRLLTERDHGCRFPGCTNTRYVDAHHVTHWEDGGSTDLANLVLLCNRHHHAQHHEEFTIEADGDGGFTFFDRWHRKIGPPHVRSRQRCRPSTGTTRARSGGDPRLDINDAVTGIACVADRPDAA